MCMCFMNLLSLRSTLGWWILRYQIQQKPSSLFSFPIANPLNEELPQRLLVTAWDPGRPVSNSPKVPACPSVIRAFTNGHLRHHLKPRASSPFNLTSVHWAPTQCLAIYIAKGSGRNGCRRPWVQFSSLMIQQEPKAEMQDGIKKAYGLKSGGNLC